MPAGKIDGTFSQFHNTSSSAFKLQIPANRRISFFDPSRSIKKIINSVVCPSTYFSTMVAFCLFCVIHPVGAAVVFIICLYNGSGSRYISHGNPHFVERRNLGGSQNCSVWGEHDREIVLEQMPQRLWATAQQRTDGKTCGSDKNILTSSESHVHWKMPISDAHQWLLMTKQKATWLTLSLKSQIPMV